MSPQEFAQKIRDKYPNAYKDLDDLTLAQKVVEKYPTYANQVDFDISEEKEQLEEKGYFESLKESAETRADKISDIKQRKDTGLIEKGVQMFGQGTGLASEVVEKGVEQIPLLRGAFEKIGKGIEWLSETKPVQALGEKIGSQDAVTEIVNLYDTDPNFKDTVNAVGNIARLGGDITMAAESVGLSKKIAEKGITTGTKAIPKAVGTVKTTGQNILSKTKGYVSKWQEKGINSEIDNLLTATKGIQNKVKVAEQKNVNLAENLKDPQVYEGLKVSNKKIDPTEAIVVIEDRIETILNAKREMLPKIDTLVPEIDKSVIRQRAISSLKGTPADNAKIIKKIDEQLEPLPNKLKPSEIDKFRAIFRQSARDAKGLQKEGSHYSALENATRDELFDITNNLPIANAEEFANLNTYIKDMITTKDFLDDTLRGQTVKGGRLGEYSARVIGAVAGSKGGVIGALAGSEAGGLISNIITNNQLGSSLKMRLVKNITDNPKAIKEAENLLREIETYTPPMLPAGGKFKTTSPSGESIPVAPEGKNIEFTGKTGITPKKKVGNISDDLTQQARKAQTEGKSFDEFVGEQGANKLYHVSDNPNLKISKDYQPKQGQLGKGLYVTKDPEIWQSGQIGKRPYVYEIDATNLKIADDYPTNEELIKWGSKNGYYKKDFQKKPNGEYILGLDGKPMKVWQETSKAEKLMDYKDPMTGSKMSGLEQEYLKSKGYDGVSASYSPDGEQSLIFNYDKVKINKVPTKPQLKQIWEGVNNN